MSKNLSAVQQDHVDYLITIGKGGNNGVTLLLKTPEDHAQWEANMRWFADALLEARPAHEHVSNDCVECLRIERDAALASPLLPQQGGEQTEKPICGVLTGESEVIGKRCKDGGACHHECVTDCWRSGTCVPLTGSGLNDDWQAPSETLNHPGTVLRVQKALGFTDSGFVDPDAILSRIAAAVLPQVGEATVPEGYQLVPINPTDAMVNAGMGAKVTKAKATFIYRYMLKQAKADQSRSIKKLHAAPASLGEAKAVAPEGWKLVPIKPTEAMHAAAVRTIVRCNGNDDFPPRVYAAMLDAAPNPPATVSDAAPVAEALPVAAEKSLTYEQRHAIKEGERNAASSEYFRARTPLMNTSANLSIFDAGFDRGFDAGVQGEKA